MHGTEAPQSLQERLTDKKQTVESPGDTFSVGQETTTDSVLGWGGDEPRFSHPMLLQDITLLNSLYNFHSYFNWRFQFEGSIALASMKDEESKT